MSEHDMKRLTDQFELQQYFSHLREQNRRNWFIQARLIREKRLFNEQREDADFEAFASSFGMATDTQIKQFSEKLDVYDEATVAALMENREKLDSVNAELKAKLERAYVMPDGRRVFRSNDGQRVYDENGREVKRDKIDPKLIGPNHPTWNSYSEGRALHAKLEAERQRILDFQKKVDSARDRIAEGPITKAELVELDADLELSLPPSIKSHMPGNVDAKTPKLSGSFRMSAQNLSTRDGAPVIDPHIQPGAL